MKKRISGLLVVLLALLLAGCAGSTQGDMGMKSDMGMQKEAGMQKEMDMQKGMKVKCPECGFEFYPKEYGG